MVKAKNKNCILDGRCLSLVLSCFFITSFLCVKADNIPIFYNTDPVYIKQGQVANIVVKGKNLNSRSIIGVTGEDVYASILKEDQAGENLTIQLKAELTAIGEKTFFLKDEAGNEANFPIVVQPPSAPFIERITSNAQFAPASNPILTIVGMDFFNVLRISTSSDDFLINSYQTSNDGNVITVSTLLKENISSDNKYFISIVTPGGEIQKEIVPGNIYELDPYSPGIYSAELSPTNKKQVILRGYMFNSEPNANTVTLLENTNGSVVGRKANIVSSNSNEIIIDLPVEISSTYLSFAVSNNDGKSSNIKTVDFNSLLKADSVSMPQVAGTTSSAIIEAANGVQQPSVIPSGISYDVNTATPPSKTVQQLTNEPQVVQNVQNLTNYLFSNSSDPKEENSSININETSDPAKLITSIEENKITKSQSDLIMIALDEAKNNQQLNESIKKAELLKSRVEELDKLLTIEKQKGVPDKKKLEKYQKLLASANSESRSQTFEILNNLLKYKPQLKNLLSQKPFDLAAIQPNIPADSVILQYVLTEEGLIIFVVDNKNLKVRINENISKDIINREVQAYRKLLENEMEKIRKTGRATIITSWKNDKSKTYKKEVLPLKEKNVFLYNSLIKPVEKDIASKKVVAVIANGWLRYLPFQSLGRLTSDGNLQFLISEKSIVYLDSVVALGEKPSVFTVTPSITVFANPDGTLLGANKEAEIISMLFSMTSKSLVQRPFNVDLINILSKKADIVHLATHGYLDSSDINSSYLVSGKKTNTKKFKESKLFIKDIYDLELSNTKLVVLSGCDTGKVGSLANEPDDVVGSLASAFRVAGANSILASLWKAHDEATKIIMQNFYENIKTGSNKAEALRKAQLKVKNNPKFSHPLFWGLFNLVGDWR